MQISRKSLESLNHNLTEDTNYQEMYYDGWLDLFIGVINNEFDNCKLLLEKSDPITKQLMIQHDNFSNFKHAVQLGHFDICKLIFDHTDRSKQQEMLISDNFAAFRWANVLKHTEITEWLQNIVSPDLIPQMIIAEENFIKLITAFAKDDTNQIIEIFENHSDSIKETLIFEDDSFVFTISASIGNLDLCKFLFSQIDDIKKQDLLVANNFNPFFHAIHGGQLEICKWLLEVTDPEVKQQMLACDDFWFFRSAAYKGDADICKFLLEHIDPDKKGEMLASVDQVLLAELLGNDFLSTNFSTQDNEYSNDDNIEISLAGEIIDLF